LPRFTMYRRGILKKAPSKPSWVSSNSPSTSSTSVAHSTKATSTWVIKNFPSLSEATLCPQKMIIPCNRDIRFQLFIEPNFHSNIWEDSNMFIILHFCPNPVVLGDFQEGSYRV